MLPKIKVALFLLPAILLATSAAQASCDIVADSCCLPFQAMGMGSQMSYLTGKGPHRVSTFLAKPTVIHVRKPNPSILEPLATKGVETSGGMSQLAKDIQAQLIREGVSPSLQNRLMVVVQELTQNAADAHVRNGTDPATRQVIVRLKVNRRQRPAKGGSEELVDQIILEVSDNAGNPTAHKNEGGWFSGGRATGEQATRARDVLDKYSAELVNPIEQARKKGITGKPGWQSSKEFLRLSAEAETHNAPILEKISDAELPPDLIAEYFDAKLPDEAARKAIMASLSQAEAATREVELQEELGFWLDMRFGVRAKSIAVENREGGMGGFGSLMLKAWGSQWVYGPNRNSSGQVVGTRTLFVLETPSGSLTNPRPIGFTEEPIPQLVRPGAAQPSTIIDPTAPRRGSGRPLILPE